MTFDKPIIAQWRQAAVALIAVAASVLAPAQNASAQTVLQGQAVPIGIPAAPSDGQQIQTQAPTFKIETTTAPLSAQQVQDLAGAPMQPGQQERLDKLPVGNSKLALLPTEGVTVARNFTGLIQAYVVRPSGNVEMYFGANIDDKSPNSVRNARLVGDNSFGGPRNDNFSIANDVIPRQTQYYTVSLAASDAEILSQNQKLLSYIANNKLITPDGRIKLAEVNPAHQQAATELQRFLAKKCLSLLPGKQQWLAITPQNGSTQPGLITVIPNGGSHVLYAANNLPPNLNPDQSVGALFKESAKTGDPSAINDAQKILAAINATRDPPPVKTAINAATPVLPVDCNKIQQDRAVFADRHKIPLMYYLVSFNARDGWVDRFGLPKICANDPPINISPADMEKRAAMIKDGRLPLPDAPPPPTDAASQPPATTGGSASLPTGNVADQVRQRMDAIRAKRGQTQSPSGQ